MVPRDELVARLRAWRDPGRTDFAGADLSGSDLSGLTLSGVSLVGARLDGADLAGTKLRHVDLTDASCARARLDGASLTFVHARGASWVGSSATDSWWEHCDLGGGDFTDVGLRAATIRSCSLDRARVDNADLARATVTLCNAEGSSFQGAHFMWANTVGTSFLDADFTDAEKFFLCREIIAEIARREAGDDPDLQGIVGMILHARKVCFPEWKAFLEERPSVRDRAYDVFGRYAKSGFNEALQSGWRPPGMRD